MKNWQDLYNTDISQLNSNELKKHIIELKKCRLEDKSIKFSANELNVLLSLAVNELGSRSALLISKVSIGIAVLSIIVSAIGIWASN